MCSSSRIVTGTRRPAVNGTASSRRIFPVHCAQARAVRSQQAEDRQALRNGGFEPRGQLLCGFSVFLHCARQPAVGIGAIGRRDNRAQVGCDPGVQLMTRHVGLGVLLQMKLAALPTHAAKCGPARHLQSLVCSADHQLHAGQNRGARLWRNCRSCASCAPTATATPRMAHLPLSRMPMERICSQRASRTREGVSPSRRVHHCSSTASS